MVEISDQELAEAIKLAIQESDGFFYASGALDNHLIDGEVDLISTAANLKRILQQKTSV